MDKKEIERILSQVATPIYQIELMLGMPKTTLQKAIKGQRVLPKKWALKLQSAYIIKKQPEKIEEKPVETPEVPVTGEKPIFKNEVDEWIWEEDQKKLNNNKK